MVHLLEPLAPQEGYDRAADIFDHWHWTEFWRRNERPLVRSWMDELKPGRSLDAGTGTGNYVPDLEERGNEVVGLDISRRMLQTQVAKLGRRSHIIQAEITRLPLTSEVFDSILCARVLSHVSDLARTMGELGRVLRFGGSVMLTDVHPDHPYEKVTVTNCKRVKIRVWKHQICELVAAISGVNGLRLEGLQEFGLNDLSWAPPEDRFKDVFSGHPVFYVCTIRKE